MSALINEPLVKVDASEESLTASDLVLFGFVLLYTILWFSIPTMPYQDLPNHVTRSFIIAKLLSETGFQELFSFNVEFVPYVLGDLMLAGILRLVSLQTGSMIWVFLCFLVPVVGVSAYLRAIDFPRRNRFLVELSAVYFATNWFFLTGYCNFSIGIGLAFMTLSAWEIYNGSGINGRIRRYSLFVLFLIASYLMHLTAFLFFGVIFGSILLVKWLTKSVSFSKAVISGLPVALLGLFHWLNHIGESQVVMVWEHRTIVNKIEAVGTMFVRFHYLFDGVLSLFFLAACVYAISFYCTTKDINSPPKSFRYQYLLALVGLMAVYIVLPEGTGTLYDVDERALPYVFIIFMVYVGVSINLPRYARQVILASFSVLLLFNFIYLFLFLDKHDRFLKYYWEALENTPAERVVLPIATVGDEGQIQTTLHFGTLYTAIGRGFSPYVFSSLKGEPFVSFHFKKRRYYPSEFWYLRNKPVDWEAVLTEYDYLVITKPYDETRLPIEHLSIVFSNRGATVFAVLKDRTPVAVAYDIKSTLEVASASDL